MEGLGGGRIAKLKAAVVDKMEDQYDTMSANIRIKYFPRWRQICNVERDEDIDFNNPYVHLEWMLCDPRVIGRLTGGKKEEAIAWMDEQQR